MAEMAARVDTYYEQIRRIENEQTRLDSRLDDLHATVAVNTDRIQRMSIEVDAMQNEWQNVEGQVAAVRNFGSITKWVLGTCVAVVSLIGGVLGLLEKWNLR